MYLSKYCLVIFDFPFTACKIPSRIPIFVRTFSEWVLAELSQILILLDLQLVIGLREGDVHTNFNLLHFQVISTILFEQESRPIFFLYLILKQ